MINSRFEYDFVEIPDRIKIDGGIMPYRTADKSKLRGEDLCFIYEAVQEREYAERGYAIPTSKWEFSEDVTFKQYKRIYSEVTDLIKQQDSCNFMHISEDTSFPAYSYSWANFPDKQITPEWIRDYYGMKLPTFILDPDDSLDRADIFKKQLILDMMSDIKKVNAFISNQNSSIYSNHEIDDYQNLVTIAGDNYGPEEYPAYKQSIVDDLNRTTIDSFFRYNDLNRAYEDKTINSGYWAKGYLSKDKYILFQIPESTAKYAAPYQVLIEIRIDIQKDIVGQDLVQDTFTYIFPVSFQQRVGSTEVKVPMKDIIAFIEPIFDEKRTKGLYNSDTWGSQSFTASFERSYIIFKMNDRTNLKNVSDI